MNCREFREGYIGLLDPESAPPAARDELAGHLKSCRDCARFYDEIARTAASLRPAAQVNASPQFKGNVMEKIQAAMEEGAPKVGRPGTHSLERNWRKLWPLALAAGIVGLLTCAALLWLKPPHYESDFATMPAITLFREACAAEDFLFSGGGIVSLVNEIIVKPVSDPTLAKLRWLPIISLDASAKPHFNQLTLPADPGEEYALEDYSWYDPETCRFVHVLVAEGKPIFANSYDGNSVYSLEPDASGLLRVVRTPVAEGFHPPKSPAEFLGIAAGFTYSLDKKDESLVSDAGRVELSDGSPGRAVKLRFPAGGPEESSNTYWLCKIRESDGTIDEMEWILNARLMLLLRHAETRRVDAPSIPWDLAGFKSDTGWPQLLPQPAIVPDMVRLDVSVQNMVAKADFETYIPRSDPPWTTKRVIADILDIVSPPHRMFAIAYRARDGRHVVLVQAFSYNQRLGVLAKGGKLVYASSNGIKVWRIRLGKWLAGTLLQSARFAIKESPVENRTGFVIETPAGTFPALAINGQLTDAELHALIDSLIPAKEYLKKSPAAAVGGAPQGRTTFP